MTSPIRFHLSAFSVAVLALAAPVAAGAQAITAADAAKRVESAAAWQQCTTKPDGERLACFDAWAREQRELLSAIEDKARSVQASPTARNTAPSAQAAAVRSEVAAALATTQPDAAPGTTPSGSAGIIGVGLEQGCRDRQFSEMSRFWELESGSSCPTFGLRAFHPTTVSVAAGGEINRQPTSPNPVNTATAPIDYSRHEMRLSLSVRTKLASGLLTPRTARCAIRCGRRTASSRTGRCSTAGCRARFATPTTCRS
ncbi:phospholipase A [Ottowia testudinis]|uniref:phospholipase A n=1 Tax=Ottowia testudinis TaxID=2816950 RepID=UPI001FB0D0D0|nr:phospholipase A [Ottowia testudinis]